MIALKNLLSSMNSILHPDTFVSVTLSESARKKTNLQPIIEFREAEGVTVVVRHAKAEQGELAYQMEQIT